MDPAIALAGAIATAGQTTERPHTITEAVNMLGGKNGTLAAIIAGTDDRKSNTYKAAMREVQRYRKHERGEGGQTRNPGKARARTKQILDKAFEQVKNTAATRQMAAQGATLPGATRVTVIVSPGGRRPDEREREVYDLYIYPDDMRPVLEAYARGDIDDAALEFNLAFNRSYGLPLDSVITDVDAMSMKAGATSQAQVYP